MINSKEIDNIFNRLDNFQRSYYSNIFEHKVVFVDAPSGTGKTTIAVMAGLEALMRGKTLIYIRFPSNRAEKLGATPGDLDEKESKYMYPFYEALEECGVYREQVSFLIEKGLIETRTDTTERGRNIKNSFVIIDEAQNAKDIEQLRLILTRLHDSSKAVVIGHSQQVDSKVRKYGLEEFNAFEMYRIHMCKRPWAISCELYNDYRGDISKWADKIEMTLNDGN